MIKTLVARLCCLALASQSACGIFASYAFRTTEWRQDYVSRPDRADAQLTCDGAPCREIHGSVVISRDSPWGYAAGMLVEAACLGAAAWAYDRTKADALHGAIDACAIGLVWDALTIPLSPLAGGLFQEQRHNAFDQKVELRLGEDKVEVRPEFLEYGGVPSVFATTQVIDRGLEPERRAARLRVCLALAHRAPARTSVHVTGEGAEAIERALADRLAADFGPPPAGEGVSRAPDDASFRVEGTSVIVPSGYRLDLRLTAGARGRELEHSRITTQSLEALLARLPAALGKLYPACAAN